MSNGIDHQSKYIAPGSFCCFGHRPFAVVGEHDLALLGPNADGYYLYKFGGNSDPNLGSAFAFSPIRLHPGAAFSLSAAAEYFHNATGQVLKFDGGYRNEENQRQAFKRALIKYGDFMITIRRVAPPGFSEHHTGLAVDLASHLDEAGIVLPFFGWEMSFPRANTQGIRHEPWHWRFVGLPAITSSLAQVKPDTPVTLVNAGLNNLKRMGIYNFAKVFNDFDEKPTHLSFIEEDDFASLRFMLNEMQDVVSFPNYGDDESELIESLFSLLKKMGVSKIPDLDAGNLY